MNKELGMIRLIFSLVFYHELAISLDTENSKDYFPELAS